MLGHATQRVAVGGNDSVPVGGHLNSLAWGSVASQPHCRARGLVFQFVPGDSPSDLMHVGTL